MNQLLSDLDRQKINNDYYHSLGQRWYSAQDDPVALLRAESKTRNQWVYEKIDSIDSSFEVLDVGCGGGFLSNFLSEKGLKVTGLDLSKESLEVAHIFDRLKNVNYVYGDAYALPFENQSYDIVTCMDFLEHVSRPDVVLKEISRVLKPGGMFFFHTFNRNWLAWLIVIKGVEWFVKNTPKDLHILEMFIKPNELINMMQPLGLQVKEIRGLRPKLNYPFFKTLFFREVDENFEFKWISSLWMSYTGWAKKELNLSTSGIKRLF